ncbi:MAG: hypothetical protein HY927_16900 [Elusimicrobia bacterium]|nr:hypothetical protein [Elusimicrobiota bacterium]
MSPRWWLPVLLLAASGCGKEPQEARSMGPPAQAGTEKRKEADFPAEKIEKPKDLAGGEGVPQRFKDVIDKRLGKSRKPKTK